MTTVAALVADGTVYMAADSCNNVYDRPVIDGAIKIRRVQTEDGKDILIGVCGNGCIANIVPKSLKVACMPDTDDPADQQAWADAVAHAITEILYEMRVTDKDGEIDGTLLLAAGGRLWSLTDYQAIPHRDGVAAIGSGSDYAMGAMVALAGTDTAPADRVWRAVEAACLMDRHTEQPILSLQV